MGQFRMVGVGLGQNRHGQAQHLALDRQLAGALDLAEVFQTGQAKAGVVLDQLDLALRSD